VIWTRRELFFSATFASWYAVVSALVHTTTENKMKTCNLMQQVAVDTVCIYFVSVDQSESSSYCQKSAQNGNSMTRMEMSVYRDENAGAARRMTNYYKYE
jgi:hypothetical protein